MADFNVPAWVPEKYAKYITGRGQLRKFQNYRAKSDMAGWEGFIGYQPPTVTPVASGVNADREAVAEVKDPFDLGDLGGLPEGEKYTSLLEAAKTNESERTTAQENSNQSSAQLHPVVSEVTGGEKGIVHKIDEANKVNTEIDKKNVPSRFDKNPTKESLPAGPEPEGGNEVLETVEVLKEKGQATGPGVSQLQEYAETMTGIKGRTPGMINAAGSATIAALSGLGKNIDEVQSGFSKFRENIRGRIASGVSALKGEVGWGSHSSEYDQFKSDLKASGLDEDTVRRGRAHSEGQDAEDAGGVEVGQEDKKKLESDAAHQKYKSDMIAQGGAIGADAFKGGGGKAVSFNRMGQY